MKNMSENKPKDGIWDIIYIGAGCAGLGGSVYSRRFGMSTLIIGELMGGTITLTHLVENYPGFTSLTGSELAQHLIDHAKANDVEIVNKRVSSIEREPNEGLFLLKVGEETYKAHTVVLATGGKHRHLNVPGEEDYTNKGVSYCATCDGPFFRGKTVGVVGGGDSAVKESLLLGEICEKVYIIYRGKEVRPEPINKTRMESMSNIEVITETNITEILGDGTKFNKVKFDTGSELELDGLFIEIGMDPLSELAVPLGVELNQKKEVNIDLMSNTNVPGFYAAGDITNTPWKQAIVGVAESTKAAYSAFNYWSAKKG